MKFKYLVERSSLINSINNQIDANSQNLKLKYEVEIMQSKMRNLEHELRRTKADYEKLRAQNQKLQTDLSANALQKFR